MHDDKEVSVLAKTNFIEVDSCTHLNPSPQSRLGIVSDAYNFASHIHVCLH